MLATPWRSRVLEPTRLCFLALLCAAVLDPVAMGAGHKITCRVRADFPGWRAAGAYALPGQRLTVRAVGRWAMSKRRAQFYGPAGSTKPYRGFTLGALIMQIGCRTDDLSKKKNPKRDPVVIERYAVGPRLVVVPKYGGLIYFYCNDGRPEDNSGHMDVAIEGAVRAPVVRKGKLTRRSYRRLLDKTEALWGELEGDYIIHCLPVERMKEIPDPNALMDWYDRLYLAYCDLDGRKPSRTKTRYVPDVEISAGTMHSGNPIMYHMGSIDRLINLDRMAFENWGAMHELGHNFQRRDYRLAETPEVDVNIFTMYGIHKLRLLDRGPLMGVYQKGLMTFYKSNCFQEWTSDPFLGLAFYYELVRGLGWQPLKKLFREYWKLPKAERPQTYEARRDLFFRLMSRCTGRNLAPFFERWGVPVSPAALASARRLPKWEGAYRKPGVAEVGIDLYHGRPFPGMALAEVVDKGLECRAIAHPYDRDRLDGVRVLLFNDSRGRVDASPEEAAVLAKWVEDGGVAIICCLAWVGKAYGKKAPDVLNANVLSRPFGISFTTTYLRNLNRSSATVDMAKEAGLREGSVFDSATIARHHLTAGVERLGLLGVSGVTKIERGQGLVWGEPKPGQKDALLVLVPHGRGWVVGYQGGLVSNEFFLQGHKLARFDNAKLWRNIVALISKHVAP